jgi:hypothetical protein
MTHSQQVQDLIVALLKEHCETQHKIIRQMVRQVMPGQSYGWYITKLWKAGILTRREVSPRASFYRIA